MLVARPATVRVGDAYEPIGGAPGALLECRFARFFVSAHQAEQVLPGIEDYALLAIARIGEGAAVVLHAEQPAAHAQRTLAIGRGGTVAREVEERRRDIPGSLTVRRLPTAADGIAVAHAAVRAAVVRALEPFLSRAQMRLGVT